MSLFMGSVATWYLGLSARGIAKLKAKKTSALTQEAALAGSSWAPPVRSMGEDIEEGLVSRHARVQI